MTTDQVQLVHGCLERVNDDVRVDRRTLGVIHARVEDGANLSCKSVAGHVGLDRGSLCAGSYRLKLVPGRLQPELRLGERRLVLLEQDRLLVVLLGLGRYQVLVRRDLLGERLGASLERTDLRIGTVDGARRRSGRRGDHKE